MPVRNEGYQGHPCQGCDVDFHGCELSCRVLERWNMQHMGDVADDAVS